MNAAWRRFYEWMLSGGSRSSPLIKFSNDDDICSGRAARSKYGIRAVAVGGVVRFVGVYGMRMTNSTRSTS